MNEGVVLCEPVVDCVSPQVIYVYLCFYPSGNQKLHLIREE